MKNLVLLFFIMALSSCKMVEIKSLANSMGLSGVNSVNDISQSEFYQEVAKTEDKYKSLFKDKKIKTSAKIQRGSEFISIDLTKASDTSKIQNDDVILLEEGIYKTFPEIKARGILVEGAGKNSTLIGDFSSNLYTDIKAEEISFSKLTLWKAYFFDTLYQQNEHSYYLFSEVRFIGGTFQQSKITNNSKEAKPYVLKDVYFSEIYDNSFANNWSQPNLPYSGYYSYFEMFAGSSSGGKRTTYFEKDNFGSMREYADSLDSSNPKSLKETDFYKIALANYKENKFLPLYPETIKAFQENLLKEVTKSRSFSNTAPETGNAVNKNTSIMNVLARNSIIEASGSRKENIDKYAQIFDEANKETRYLTALLAASLKYEEISLTAGFENAAQIYDAQLKQAANKYSCTRETVKVENAAESEQFYQLLSAKYPILQMNAEKSNCRLNYIQNLNIKSVYRSGKGVSTSPIMAETIDSIRRTAALRKATQEATKAKWEAQAKLSADRLLQAGNALKKTGARFGQVGNTQYLIYNEGNFSPKDDPLLKYSADTAERKLEALTKANNGGQKFEQIDTITTNSYYAVNNFNYEATLQAKFSNGNNILIKGPLERYTASKYCEDRRTSNGSRIISYNDDVRDCKGFDEISFRKYVEAYDRDNIMYYFEEAFFENEMVNNVTTASKYLNSSDPKEQLEGYIMSVGLGLDIDTSKLQELTEIVLGKRLSVLDVKMRISKR